MKRAHVSTDAAGLVRPRAGTFESIYVLVYMAAGLGSINRPEVRNHDFGRVFRNKWYESLRPGSELDYARIQADQNLWSKPFLVCASIESDVRLNGRVGGELPYLKHLTHSGNPYQGRIFSCPLHRSQHQLH